MSSRATYVIRDGELIEKHLAGPLHEASDAPMYISDHMDTTKHMANGKLYDSKSEFRKATKTAGCVEVGNDPMKPIPRPVLSREQRARDIKQAIEQLRAQQ